MKPAATSKEEILSVCRDLLHRQGDTVLNVREVAAACGISVGTVYNYFGSKADLVSAAVESVWYDIFRCKEGGAAFRTTRDCVSWLFARLSYGNAQYPGFFTLHSLSFVQADRTQGQQRMEQIWQHIRQMLCTVLRQDPEIQPHTFDRTFTPEQFADILFSLMLAAQLRKNFDPLPALHLVERTLYTSARDHT